jgi:hypothetical protein
VCSSYHYHYAYHPKAAILVRGSAVNGQQYATVVMIVGNDEDEEQLVDRGSLMMFLAETYTSVEFDAP